MIPSESATARLALAFNNRRRSVAVLVDSDHVGTLAVFYRCRDVTPATRPGTVSVMLVAPCGAVASALMGGGVVTAFVEVGLS